MVETFYLHLRFTNKKDAWSINLPFLCSKCGVCCTLDDFLTAGEVNAKPEEYTEVHSKLKALFETLGKIFEISESKYDQYIQQSTCPFLVNNLCSIYEIRPDRLPKLPQYCIWYANPGLRSPQAIQKNAISPQKRQKC